jgi:anaerobic ribonucleoside-triphosphate reductase activating protein
MDSSNLIRLAGVEPESIVDGRGFRYVIFVQGCPHHCPGCHNPQTHSFEGGILESPERFLQEMKENPLLRGVTFSGGEPFCQAQALSYLAKKIKEETHLDLTVFSGWTYEELLAKKDYWTDQLLALSDYLIDGPFIKEQMDLSLQFRGSSNQRVIDLNATRKAGCVVLDNLDE